MYSRFESGVVSSSMLNSKSSIVFFSSRRLHTRYWRDWSSDVCSSDLVLIEPEEPLAPPGADHEDVSGFRRGALWSDDVLEQLEGQGLSLRVVDGITALRAVPGHVEPQATRDDGEVRPRLDADLGSPGLDPVVGGAPVEADLVGAPVPESVDLGRPLQVEAVQDVVAVGRVRGEDGVLRSAAGG